jgi:hypothetical protein
MKREVVGERVAEEKRTEHHGDGDAHGAEENFCVERIGEEFFVIGEIPVMDEGAVLHGPEAVRKHQCVGQQEEERYPEKRRGGDDRFVGARVHVKSVRDADSIRD